MSLNILGEKSWWWRCAVDDKCRKCNTPCRIFNLYDDSSDKRNKIDLQLLRASFLSPFKKIAIGICSIHTVKKKNETHVFLVCSYIQVSYLASWKWRIEQYCLACPHLKAEYALKKLVITPSFQITMLVGLYCMIQLNGFFSTNT